MNKRNQTKTSARLRQAHWSPCGRGPLQPLKTAASRLATETPLAQDCLYSTGNMKAMR